MVKTYRFTIAEIHTDLNGNEFPYVDFDGETEAEARKYATMSGWTVMGEATVIEDEKPVYELPDYISWCASLGINPS